ncbi:nitrate/nitrite transporter [Catenulispora pinisilvae]|uniref:nitrate/nitrite transporter n=1 Tax=Catenulispora pinisilvae TaxID=2705253 RepID=UPI001890EAB1|nr:nitrate/nitrite transporter [Catenulispora pinisilvae]
MTATTGATTTERNLSDRDLLAAWNPEDEDLWAAGARRIARRNLAYSILSEHIGFSVWSLWSVLVLFLGPDYHVDAAGKFLLTSLPTAVGSVLRLPYSFAVTRFGGRSWTVFSALILLVPCGLCAFLIKPGVSYSTLLILAAVTGVGGGNFASSMTNINTFYPDRLKGWALGLNAGGGNVGVAAVQLVGLAVLAWSGKGHPGLVAGIYLPLIVVAAVGSALWMDNLPNRTAAKGAIREVAKSGRTWVISVLYIGTFGSFIGFGFAFGQVLQVQFKTQFATPVDAAYLTFLGPLLGSLSRPIGGRLADRLGGARVTLVTFAAMAASAVVVLAASEAASLAAFVTGFVLLFVFSGVGNGSVYKMIPALFAGEPEPRARRLSGALIGLAGAVGAFGGVLVNMAFRQSFLSTKNGDAAYWTFLAFYALCAGLTWAVFMRRAGRTVREAAPAIG